MRTLNNQWRGIDRTTDVLSFPMLDNNELAAAKTSRIPVILGDIVISAPKAERQARQIGHSLEREMTFLVVHGLLHLFGYDHETGKDDEARMIARQRELMEALDAC
jgi:probable rRNA maturation factor